MPRHVRLVVAVMAAAVAVPVTASIVRLAGLQRSTWVRVVVDAERPAPPNLTVGFGPRMSERVAVVWDNSARPTLLGLRSNEPALLTAIETDRAVIPPWLAPIWGTGWRRQSNPPGLLVQGSGIVEIPGAFQRITLTFEPGRASVDAGWLDQQAHLDLQPAPAPRGRITLAIPALHRGWALLPPVSIGELSLWSEPSGPFTLRQLSVRGPVPEAWRPLVSDPIEAGGIERCPTRLVEDAVRVEALPASACAVPLVGLAPLNQVSALIRAGVWMLVALCGVPAFAALGVSARGVDRLWQRYDLVETAFASWLRVRTRRWSMGRVMGGVGIALLVYHLSYVWSVPTQFTYDSLGYYAFGRNLLHTLKLGYVAPCRTPGYPAAIALSILFSGEHLWTLALVQHLSLVVLGLVSVWFLYSRVGPAWAALAGLLAGASPLMAAAASVVWTEALFASIGTVALLVFLRAAKPRLGDLFLAGMLAGVATLVRPNGLVVAALMAAWLFGRWCLRSPAEGLSRLAIDVGAVIVGCGLVVSIWAVHVHRATGNWVLTDANCGQEGQRSYAVSKPLSPTSIFQLAGLFNFLSQNDDVHTLAVSEPFRVFSEFFPAPHRYWVGRFVPWELYYDDRYPGELLREYVRAFRWRYLRQVTDALFFNLTHVERPHASVFVDTSLRDAVEAERARVPADGAADPRAASLASAATVTWSDAEVLLTHMRRSEPAGSAALGSLHTRISGLVMSIWGAIGGLAALATVLVVALPGYRRYVVLAAHAGAVVVAPAMLGMGVDRYAMVGEPALYLLIVVLCSLALGHRVERRPASAGTPLTVSKLS